MNSKTTLVTEGGRNDVPPRIGGVNVTDDAWPDDPEEHDPPWLSFIAICWVPSLLYTRITVSKLVPGTIHISKPINKHEVVL